MSNTPKATEEKSPESKGLNIIIRKKEGRPAEAPSGSLYRQMERMPQKEYEKFRREYRG